ncbi:hypothetical protein [Acidihalobacter prosperus]|uniref:Uncharacterized protein n=1 Tax=Acidihalobacter prosperus TaxID=160660 RepID=A0A1A6C3L9_9GAMM|nr:hypothetical protein [Acidihalobacter prosperus]OBS09140.1 hypothetical protein Thpro_021468 [Acidihalobacter prosperus]
MRIVKRDKQSVTISLSETKAQDLLDGLLAHPELGDAAAELGAKLKEAGVQPPRHEDHIRYEHASPLNH